MIAMLESGREAVRGHAWAEAVGALSAADRDAALGPDDLELLGNAAWWAGQPDDSVDALQRAFAGFAEGGRTRDAARVALWLAYHHFRRQADSIAGGWLARAEALLEDDPESGLQAWLDVFAAVGAVMEFRLDDALAVTDRAMETARRFNQPDALFLAMSFRGMADLLSGNWQAGLARIDQAAAAAASGQLDLRVASDIFCNTISSCRSLGDLRRAAQWTVESDRWMQRNAVGGYPGICRVHRAELRMLHGDWPEAEQEARSACDELQRFGLLDGVGFAQYQIGEVRLRMGDLDAAAEAFDLAYERGHPAQPGLALLQLARGQVDEAGRSIARALAAAAGSGGPADRAARGRLLPAQVDIALAAGDLDTAGRAVEELEEIARGFDRPLFTAGALTARGELLLGEKRASDASPVLGQSWRLWQTTDLPYESARTRVQYARALIAEGDTDAARRDLLAARATLERLGATRELEQVDALLGGQAVPPRRSTPERATRTFMFTDIVTSTDLVGLIGDEAWSELLRWHDRELRSAIARHRGIEVSHTGDGLFAAFNRPLDAVECAVDIQRRLARHRHEHGFAPSVRIGLHGAEATREGRNYSGRGVHVAARVGAAAAGEEILASTSVLDGLGRHRFTLSEPRSLSLKGVREPVEVRAVDWR
jgi:class 3 adenylate cyclase